MLHQLADFLVRMIGLILIFSAVIWQINPVKVTKVFGIPNPTAEKATLGPALGCRKAAVGLMLLYLSFNGHRDVIAPLLAFWITCVGLEDVYLGYLYGAGIRVHVINIGIGFGVVTLLWMT